MVGRTLLESVPSGTLFIDSLKKGYLTGNARYFPAGPDEAIRQFIQFFSPEHDKGHTPFLLAQTLIDKHGLVLVYKVDSVSKPQVRALGQKSSYSFSIGPTGLLSLANVQEYIRRGFIKPATVVSVRNGDHFMFQDKAENIAPLRHLLGLPAEVLDPVMFIVTARPQVLPGIENVVATHFDLKSTDPIMVCSSLQAMAKKRGTITYLEAFKGA